jgi:very-short-patch-repair endonuclease
VTLIRAGLPRPESQVEIRDAYDGFVARVDFAYVPQRVVIEYDGAWHWQTRRHDDRRRDALRALGWTVIVVSAEDLARPVALIAQVRGVLALSDRPPAAQTAQ